jgi:ATP/maltotriose-dependent transcriptional regulator MalT
MRKLQILGKLKMQYCAILSQVHRHKDALTEAKEGVKISHQLINDLKQLSEFYMKREEIENTIQASQRNLSRNPNDTDLNYGSYYT